MRIFFLAFPIGLALLLLTGACSTTSPVSNTELSSIYRKTDLEESRRALGEADFLTLDLACAVAERNNPNYIAIQYSVNAAKMRYYQSLGAYLPAITAGFSVGQSLYNSYDTVNPPIGTPDNANRILTQTQVTASYLIFDGFSRLLSTLIAQREFRREAAVEQQVLWMLRFSVAGAYADWLDALEKRAIAERNRDFQKRMLEFTKSGFEAGKRYEDEVINFHMIMRAAEADVITAQNSVDAAEYTLAVLMGFTDGVLPGRLKPPPLSSSIAPLPYDPAQCIEIMRSNNPQLRAVEESRVIAEYAKYKTYAAFSPTITGKVGYGFGTEVNHYNRDSYSRVFDGNFQYGLEANWLLFNGMARYFSMRSAQQLYRAAQFQVGQTYLELVGATRTACSNYNRLASNARIFQEMIPPAFRQRELVVDRFRDFQTGVDRVDRVQEQVVNCETALAANLTGLIRTRAQLEMLLCVSLHSPEGPNVRIVESLLPTGRSPAADPK